MDTSFATVGAMDMSSLTAIAGFAKPHLTRDKNIASITKAEAIQHLASLVVEGQNVIGIGSPRASLESNFLLRTLVGPDRFYAGVDDHQYHLVLTMLDILRTGPCRSPSLREVELSDAVLILGEDVTNVAPRMALSLRQSVRQQPMQSS